MFFLPLFYSLSYRRYMFTAEILENTKKGKKINFHHRQDFLIFKYTH